MGTSFPNRRQFLEAMGMASVAAAVGSPGVPPATAAESAAPPAPPTEKLALDGGAPVRAGTLSSRPYGPQFYDEAEQRELLDVLRSRAPFRWWHAGSKVLEFEEAYSRHISVKHALAVTSGTTALLTAMAALEIGPGDEVILPAWTWYADYDAVVLAGALPVFAEIDESFDLDPGDIEARITPRTKAVIVCHLQGTPADLDPILEIARRHKLRVLEDCAQCLGGKYRGRYVGSIGDIAINSFQLSKTITAGEGGAVVTNDSVLFERAMRFHDVGSVRSPYQEALGGGLLAAFAACNFRMNEFTGAVLKAQLGKLETICRLLRQNAKTVRDGIADLPGLKLRKTGDLEGDIGVGVFIDLGTRQRRDRFLRALRAEGIAANGPAGSVILPTDQRIENKVTVHPAWPSFNSPEGKAIRYGAACCPRTIDIIGRFGGVVMDPRFTQRDLEDIIRAIRKVFPAVMRS